MLEEGRMCCQHTMLLFWLKGFSHSGHRNSCKKFIKLGSSLTAKFTCDFSCMDLMCVAREEGAVNFWSQ